MYIHALSFNNKQPVDVNYGVVLVVIPILQMMVESGFVGFLDPQTFLQFPSTNP
jgi:hypothetical protein